MDCYYCKAKKYCMAAAQPGSMMCLVNRMRYGGTHADDAPPRQVGGFCQYCGQPLREIGRERFCNNVNCRNRYVSVTHPAGGYGPKRKRPGSQRTSGIQRSWCGAKSAATWRSLAVTGNVAVATWALCARMIIAAGDGDEKKAPDNSASGSGRAGDRRGLAG